MRLPAAEIQDGKTLASNCVPIFKNEARKAAGHHEVLGLPSYPPRPRKA
jgi:hypothetical protein